MIFEGLDQSKMIHVHIYYTNQGGPVRSWEGASRSDVSFCLSHLSSLSRPAAAIQGAAQASQQTAFQGIPGRLFAVAGQAFHHSSAAGYLSHRSAPRPPPSRSVTTTLSLRPEFSPLLLAFSLCIF
ncbi:hypothetical protein ABZX51_001534 [Aspergillus tubingensis]